MDSAVAQERVRAKPADVLRYPFAPPAADGSHVEIVPGLLWLRMPMPMALDHINVYLLRDGDGWAVVDTGLGIPGTFELWERIFTEKLAGQPLTRVICTHCHYDHAGAAWWLQERFGVPLLMSYGEFMMLRSLMGPPPDPLPEAHREFYARAGVSSEELDDMLAAMRKDPFMPRQPSHYQRIRPGEVLQIGERRWRIVLGEGHSPEHACLYCEEDGILLAGDQVLPRITSNVMVSPIEPEGNPLKLWIDSLHRLRELPAETLVLPSHQGVFYGLHERLVQVLEHHAEQFALLTGHLGQVGRATAAELVPVLFPRLRSPVDRLMALGETIAHLNLLHQDGTLLRTPGEGKIAYFSLA
ncbi:MULTISPECIES: MBL fold metallo-hydrolase [Comamonas]|uniref:MBL fold metallo-hydrolase n=1 Tax=Comamonas TaxID=283 RepID=UPI0005103B25|nr:MULTISPECIES: MBL fold metallo-hydrolase [Comamonas]KGG84993.1 beta-lactamase [Comamonas thiooxydans]KGG95133.1 beta-lactamase [Comamonas thiooxydans]KGG96745.1 beta-lactamase [Comamonas thiooxydans]KGH06115.1 beta-lactamase [Comamonas thiooxydans]TZG08225.1 MBL fold metallo-hydrolase [Comamonas thiooxydans]